METSISISRLADIIIVVGFLSIAFTAFAFYIASGIIDIVDSIKARRSAKKERKAKETKQEEAKKPET